jgi:hypothetical protein
MRSGAAANRGCAEGVFLSTRSSIEGDLQFELVSVPWHPVPLASRHLFSPEILEGGGGGSMNVS